MEKGTGEPWIRTSQPMVRGSRIVMVFPLAADSISDQGLRGLMFRRARVTAMRAQVIRQGSLRTEDFEFLDEWALVHVAPQPALFYTQSRSCQSRASTTLRSSDTRPMRRHMQSQPTPALRTGSVQNTLEGIQRR